MFNFLPWRYKFWVVCEAEWDLLTVVRARVNPVQEHFPDWYLVAGPFDSNEDAARALAFWTLQMCLKDDCGGGNYEYQEELDDWDDEEDE